MKKQLLLFIAAIISINCYSQITFEKGYYINNANEKISGFIKNAAWKNNPTEFEYKASENSNPKKITITAVKEFEIFNASKYIRAQVNIDRSSENANSLSENKQPEFNEETLLLKVLVEGKSSLYEYVDGNIRRYFFNKENSNIEQLIYKSYRTNDKKIGKNNGFRQQLWTDLKCSNFKANKFNSINYKKNDLVKFFNEYSECHNTEVVNFEKKQQRDLFNLTIRPRINNSSFSIKNPIANFGKADFEDKIGFGIGLEAEFILPFNKNKWAIAIEPTYQNYKSDFSATADNVSGGIINGDIEYSSIEVPVGVRHYLFLNNNSKLFINAAIVFDLSSKSSIELTRDDGSTYSSLDVESRNNLGFGLGYKQNDKLSLEFRFQTGRELIKKQKFNPSGRTSDYKTMSLILGYSFL